MLFNHYAKIKHILDQEPEGWFIRRINKPTSAKNFKGQTVQFAYYYRIYTCDNKPIKYCKFQQIELLARILNVPIELLPVTYKSGKSLEYPAARQGIQKNGN